MKQLTKYNRVAGYLNSVYDMLNQDFFGNKLERPVITIQSTPKAYGHFTVYDAWSVADKGYKEINIGAGTLARPIEDIIATLIHEMCHQLNATLGIQDCSRGGTYHNSHFKQSAEAHGLTVSRSEKYGWTITAPADELLEWILTNNLTDIPMNRNEFGGVCIGGGDKSANGGINRPPTRSHSRKYVCPECNTIVRATKAVNVICGDCLAVMVG